MEVINRGGQSSSSLPPPSSGGNSINNNHNISNNSQHASYYEKYKVYIGVAVLLTFIIFAFLYFSKGSNTIVPKESLQVELPLPVEEQEIVHHFGIAKLFTSNMVLPRSPQRATIWGWCDSIDSKITFTFNGKHYPADVSPEVDPTAGYFYRWVIRIPHTEAGGPYSIIISDGFTTITLKNILFGDIYLCTGESNMLFTVKQTLNSDPELQSSRSYTQVRLLALAESYPPSELADVDEILEGWSMASNISLGANENFYSYFSAVCWFFGKSLYDNTKVPIGLIAGAVKESSIQAWIPKGEDSTCLAFLGQNIDELEELEEEEEIIEEIEDAVGWEEPTQEDTINVERRRSLSPSTSTPSLPTSKRATGSSGYLYNGFVSPLKPLHIKGVVWYQGESDIQQSQYYKCAFQVMIEAWRDSLDLPDLPFFYVELQPYIVGEPGDVNLPNFRLVQRSFVLTSMNVYMATAVDLGDITSRFDSINPRLKKDVANRLVKYALNVNYEGKEHALGPFAFDALEVNLLQNPNDDPSSNRTYVVRVRFLAGTTGEKLILTDAQCPSVIANTPYCGTQYEVLFSDGNWVSVTPDFHFDLRSLLLSCEYYRNQEILSVRYGYADWPVINLYGSYNIPASPFHLEVKLPTKVPRDDN